jgi:hypothetical protein
MLYILNFILAYAERGTAVEQLYEPYKMSVIFRGTELSLESRFSISL